MSTDQFDILGFLGVPVEADDDEFARSHPAPACDRTPPPSDSHRVLHMSIGPRSSSRRVVPVPINDNLDSTGEGDDLAAFARPESTSRARDDLAATGSFSATATRHGECCGQCDECFQREQARLREEAKRAERESDLAAARGDFEYATQQLRAAREARERARRSLQEENMRTVRLREGEKSAAAQRQREEAEETQRMREAAAEAERVEKERRRLQQEIYGDQLREQISRDAARKEEEKARQRSLSLSCIVPSSDLREQRLKTAEAAYRKELGETVRSAAEQKRTEREKEIEREREELQRLSEEVLGKTDSELKERARQREKARELIETMQKQKWDKVRQESERKKLEAEELKKLTEELRKEEQTTADRAAEKQRKLRELLRRQMELRKEQEDIERRLSAGWTMPATELSTMKSLPESSIMPRVLRLVALAGLALACRALVSQNSANAFSKQFYPAWKQLYLTEGASDYPFPPTSGVNSKLIPKGLQGVKGIAVSTDPGKTVSEGQGYAMFAAAMAGDIESLKGLTVGWQAMTQGVAGGNMLGGCSSVGNRGQCLCNAVEGADMPAWRFPLSNCAGTGCTGSAPDGDEDAVTGIIYLAELTNDDSIRQLAVRSIAAFVDADLGGGPLGYTANSRDVPVKGSIPAKHQRMFLWRGGSCWGGYDTSSGDANRDMCVAPAYFSPAQWRLFARYVEKYPQYVPTGFTSQGISTVIDSAITWGYNLLNRISCSSGIVSNWWTLPAGSNWPWNGKLQCTNSGTAAGEYGSDACRMPWRVALDALWFGVKDSMAPLYSETGSLLGYWGAANYSYRWSRTYRQMMKASGPSCPGDNCVPYYQVFPMLTSFPKCDNCPKGFTASPWNAWGFMPVVSAFAVVDDSIGSTDSQKWLDTMAYYLTAYTWPTQYFDKGLEVITTGIMGGKAPLPIGVSPQPDHSSTPSPQPQSSTHAQSSAAPQPQSSSKHPPHKVSSDRDDSALNPNGATRVAAVSAAVAVAAALC
eukprot:m51a1_g422 hypothetical protein (993) ;mRNA; r:19240-23273